MYENINALAHTWQWTVGFGFLCLIYLERIFMLFWQRKLLERKRKSFETYRNTGAQDEAFDSLTGAGAEAAGRAHAAVVSERLHKRTRFVATSDCPKCSYVDTHRFTRRNNCPEDRTVIRTCSSCKFSWRES